MPEIEPNMLFRAMIIGDGFQDPGPGKGMFSNTPPSEQEYVINVAKALTKLLAEETPGD